MEFAQHPRYDVGTATVVAENRVTVAVVDVVATVGLVETDVVNMVVAYSRRLRLRRIVVVIDTVKVADP